MARILLGVSAGIAIYKAADLASKLTQRGDEVRCLMTPRSQKFVTAVTFRAVTQQPVYTDIFDADLSSRPEHISLPEWADLFMMAPASADLIAGLAGGFGDNIVTVTALACDKPMLVAPAMNDRMWANTIVQHNIERLQQFGFHILKPEAGHLACGSVGPGRLPEAPVLMQAIDDLLPD